MTDNTCIAKSTKMLVKIENKDDKIISINNICEVE
jgi:hypothetical protein